MKYVLLFMLVASCASRPQLYPNQKFKDVGTEASKKDIDQCIADAKTYPESSKGKQIAKGAGSGPAVGAAMGAVGAAGGGAAGAMSPDQVKRNYVNHCLTDKGYRVIGWD